MRDKDTTKAPTGASELVRCDDHKPPRIDDGCYIGRGHQPALPGESKCGRRLYYRGRGECFCEYHGRLDWPPRFSSAQVCTAEVEP